MNFEKVLLVVVIIAVFVLYKRMNTNKKPKHYCGCDKGIGDPNLCRCGGAIKQQEESKSIIENNVANDEKSNINDNTVNEVKQNTLTLKGDVLFLDFLDDLSRSINVSKDIIVSGGLSQSEYQKTKLHLANDTELFLKCQYLYNKFNNTDAVEKEDTDYYNGNSLYLVKGIIDKVQFSNFIKYCSLNNFEVVYDKNEIIVLLPNNSDLINDFIDKNNVECVLLLKRENNE